MRPSVIRPSLLKVSYHAWPHCDGLFFHFGFLGALGNEQCPRMNINSKMKTYTIAMRPSVIRPSLLKVSYHAWPHCDGLCFHFGFLGALGNEQWRRMDITGR